jgi:hypothetical protein
MLAGYAHAEEAHEVLYVRVMAWKTAHHPPHAPYLAIVHWAWFSRQLSVVVVFVCIEVKLIADDC